MVQCSSDSLVGVLDDRGIIASEVEVEDEAIGRTHARGSAALA
jgi:hypothetical protein